jgi:hypothetical protein
MADGNRHLEQRNRIALGSPWAMKVSAGEFTKTAADSPEYPQSEKQLPRVLDWQKAWGRLTVTLTVTALCGSLHKNFEVHI